MTPLVTHATPPRPATGGRLVAADGSILPLRGGSLDVEAAGGIARVVLRQRFANPAAEPLQVTYQLPLPPEAAVGGYAFTLGDRRIVGEIDRLESARERFTDAILEGRTASLLEETRSSVFTQEVGNLPPGEEIECELVIDQPLRWLPGGRWEWRFPTVVAPRYAGADGRVPDADRVAVDVADPDAPGGGRLPARLSLELRLTDGVRGGAVDSPSHRILADGSGELRTVRLAEEDTPLDRDLVVRWDAAEADPRLTAAVARPETGDAAADAYALLTLMPPTDADALPATSRHVVLLIDTSGSMGGEPLEAAKAIATGLVDSLGPADRLEMTEFSSRPTAWSRRPRACGDRARAAARRWIDELEAGGGTEMASGLAAALEGDRGERAPEGEQRQIVLLTDGGVSFEREIVARAAAARDRNVRLHTVGVGSASNRSLTEAAARAGGGREHLVGLDEPLEPAIAAIVAALAKPMVTDVRIAGDAVRRRPGGDGDGPVDGAPDLLAGEPLLIPIAVDPAGGRIEVSGRTTAGPWRRTVELPAASPGTGRDSVPRLWARRRVANLEVASARGEAVDGEIEAIGLAHGIATRRTAWVATSEEPTVDPWRPTRRVRVPQELPHGMSVAGLGLRGAGRIAGRGRTAIALDLSPWLMIEDDAPPTSGAMPSIELAMPVSPLADDGPDDDDGGEIVELRELVRSARLGDRRRPADAPPEIRVAVVHEGDDLLVLEIAATAGVLDWSPSELELADGRHLAVDREASTAPGRIQGDTTARLVVRGPDARDAAELLCRRGARIRMESRGSVIIRPGDLVR